MEHEHPRLAEALTEERTWDDGGITVLSASVTLPQLDGESCAARRFNRYYRRFCRAYLAYCDKVLLPDAAGSCRAAMETSAPWSAARAELSWRASLSRGDILSVVCDSDERVCGMPPFFIRRAEVWDLGMGLPIPAQEFFPPHTHLRRTLLRFARGEVRERAESGALFRDNWRVMLRRALDTRNYCLSGEGLVFFYPLGAIADAKEGIVSFTMAYDEEKGPFPPPA